MNPGRELDQEIAVKVMGWKELVGAEAICMFENGSVTPKMLDPERWHRKRIWVKEGERDKMACEECGSLPEFSSDISAALSVAGQLKRVDVSKKDDGKWWVGSFEGFVNGEPDSSVVSDSLPLAICLWALKTRAATSQST